MGKKILIIDDDRHLLVGLTARLKASGYSVFSATDVMSGMTMARTELPDLIILDLGLPGDDGFQVLERMKGSSDQLAPPVIVLTARDPATNDKRARDAGAVAFFQKPPDNRLFMTAIRQALGEKTGLSNFLKMEPRALA
jgi:DNA-binding response OmpR family regulator